MPWGSWITCEETVNGPDVGPDFTGASNTTLTKPHGYVFEVPARRRGATGSRSRRRAGSPTRRSPSTRATGILYLTEDNFGFPSGFYRYIPPRNPMKTGRLDDGGRLQMLAVKGEPNAHLEASQRKRATYEVEWVDIDDPDPDFAYTPGQTAPTTNDKAINYVGDQGRAQGAACFSRLEGQVYDDGVVYFTSTQGGGARRAGTTPTPWPATATATARSGPTTPAPRRCSCVYQSPGPRDARLPRQHHHQPSAARWWSARTAPSTTTSAASPAAASSGTSRSTGSSAARPACHRYGDEFAGSTFSPDGHTLFVNIQASRGHDVRDLGPLARDRRLRNCFHNGPTDPRTSAAQRDRPGRAVGCPSVGAPWAHRALPAQPGDRPSRALRRVSASAERHHRRRGDGREATCTQRLAERVDAPGELSTPHHADTSRVATAAPRCIPDPRGETPVSTAPTVESTAGRLGFCHSTTSPLSRLVTAHRRGSSLGEGTAGGTRVRRALIRSR